MTAPSITVTPLGGLPEVRPGDDVGRLLLAALDAAQIALADGDVVAVTQKILSKAEGRVRRLDTVTSSPRAEALARETRKDPRLVELILGESREIVRTRRDLIIAEHRLGMVLANAGIDRSNVAEGEDAVLLLPLDPDGSARKIRATLAQASGTRIGVIVTDSVGRAWRKGTVGIAIGTAGVAPFTDLRGRRDRNGRVMQVSEIAPADSLAAIAVLTMGESAEGTPAALIRGGSLAGLWSDDETPASAVIRPRAEDLFR